MLLPSFPVETHQKNAALWTLSLWPLVMVDQEAEERYSPDSSLPPF